MSAQLEALTKALRDLPYIDMMKVADVVRTALGKKATRIPELHEMADALAAVRPLMTSIASEVAQEEEVFALAIRRKRQIIVEPQPHGWRVSIPGTHASCVSTDLRHALNTVLDQFVMLKAMECE